MQVQILISIAFLIVGFLIIVSRNKHSQGGRFVYKIGFIVVFSSFCALLDGLITVMA